MKNLKLILTTLLILSLGAGLVNGRYDFAAASGVALIVINLLHAVSRETDRYIHTVE